MSEGTKAITLADQLKGVGPPGRIVAELAVAGTRIAAELARAALAGQLGTTGGTNVQGETVKKLDVRANDIVVEAMRASGVAGLLVSEEMDEPLVVGDGAYVVCFDPVDGSSNLDINGIVGTIFSVRPRRGQSVAADAAQAGTAQLAAGYIMYGASTLMALTTGAGVDAFTLEPATGEFVRSHRSLTLPARGRIYSVNEANAPVWQSGIREFVDYLRTRDKASGRPYTARYVGSMVADIHRTLIEGGIFMYPAEEGADRTSGGKLRLQYEAAPMSFLVEQAGGKASTGRERILDIRPASPHQRVPILIGSRDDVTLAEAFVAGRR